jgi:Amt family ammonium transporter
MKSKRWWFVSIASSVIAALAMFTYTLAQEPKAPTTPAPSEVPKTADAPKAADAPKPSDVATTAAPTLPAYFTASNPDPKEHKPDTWPDNTGSAAGVWATPASDGTGDVPSKMTNPDLYDRIVHNMFSVNIVWTLVTGFLVMFMQAGFAMVETGLCRAKNASHTFSMNFMIYPLGCLAFWVYGFALGWGNLANGPAAPGAIIHNLGPGISILNSGAGAQPAEDPTTHKPTGAYKYGIVGTKGFLLNGMEDMSVMALFFFMMVFMDTTATIPTGAMAERWAWKNFCLYGLWVALPYCLYANWLWGGGWLAQGGVNWSLGHGAVDFAGSGVVHGMGGIIGLAGAMVIGPRIGKYLNGKPQAIPAHHIPMVCAGTFILAFGWFGFNPGSTLAGTDLRIALVTVNTMLASVAGAFSAMLWMMLRGKKPDPSLLCNGMLAGLVAITAPCAFVSALGAVIIGAIAGVLCLISVVFFDNIGVDDPVGAISVHGINGLWGVLSVGIFATGNYGAGWNGVVRDEYVKAFGSDGVRGILYGDPSQLWMQLIDCAVLCVFGFIMAYAWFKLSNLITPIRVSRETEIQGLDLPEMGALGYPDFTLIHHPTGTPAAG